MNTDIQLYASASVAPEPATFLLGGLTMVFAVGVAARRYR
jgi:hypothetical protein